MKKRKVWIVGAGPGAADLLTLRALKCIQNADVILTDALVSEEIRLLFPDHALVIDVGKRSGDGKNQETRQQCIHNQLLNYYLSGNQVVRLKSGDPMIYGRAVEEIRFLAEWDIAFELIPGISAGIAAANEFWIPLTERGKVSGIHFHSAIKRTGKKSKMNDVIKEINKGDTVLIYMGLEQLKNMVCELRKGLDKETNIHVVSQVSSQKSSVVSGNTEFFQQINTEELPESPAVIIIGNHVNIPVKRKAGIQQENLKQQRKNKRKQVLVA